MESKNFSNTSLTSQNVEGRLYEATEGEIKNHGHVVDAIPLRVWIVAFIGMAERFTFYGITAPWRMYSFK